MQESMDYIARCRKAEGMMEEEMSSISLALDGELKERYRQLVRYELEELKQVEKNLLQYQV